jgi:type I restriction enzyme S subunit
MSKTVKYIKLKEICTVNQGLQIPIEKRFKEKKENRYFYITVQFLKESYKEKYYIENPPKSSISKKDDILVVRTGNTGQIITGIEGCFHNNFFKINYDKNKIFGRFLYYCLITKEKQREMAIRAGITTIPDLNHFMFLDMKVPSIEDLEQQEKISNVLDVINTKIELNNKINAELEQMAKTLYDYWFVQFDFPDENGKPYKSSGGEMIWSKELKRDIPKGWEVKKMSDLLPVITGKQDANFATENGKYNFFTCGDEILKCNSYEFEGKAVLIAGNGNFGIKLYEGKFNAYQRTYILIPNNEKYYTIIYLAVKDKVQSFKNSSRGSIIKFITKGDIENILIPLPKDQNLDVFTQLNTITEKIEKNLEENQKLAELRDFLLPMLMNGQIVVE